MIRNTAAMDRPVERGKGTRRTLLIALGVVGLVALIVFGWSTARGWFGADRSFDRSRLRFATVTRGDLLRDLAVQGRVVAAFHPTLSSPADGIARLSVEAGAVVEEGQVLATIESPELVSRLAQERSTLQSLISGLERERISAKEQKLATEQAIDLAAVGLEAAQRAMARAERSREEGILNQVDYETAQDELRRSELSAKHARQNGSLETERLEFEVRNRELEVERQRLVVVEQERQVERLQVRSPVDGLVSRLDVRDHDAVTTGQAVVTVVDLSALEVEIMIPEAFADEVGPSTPVEVSYERQAYAAAIRSISPEVQGNQVRARVAFEGGTPERLRQNQRLSARLLLEKRDDVLKVERGPFVEAGGGRQAYIVDGRLATRASIELGAMSVGEVEVTGGLQEGDTIVVSDTARFEGVDQIYLRN